MELPQAAPGPARERLKEIREALLSLHKALLDSERTSYEIVHGKIASPAAFLQLLINDAGFRWLQPITMLLVQIDEALAAKNPPSDEKYFEQLITDTRALLSPSRDANEFWNRYANALERDPVVALLHEELTKRFG